MKKRKVLKIIGKVILCILIIFAVFLGYLTIREYRPEEIETVDKP